LKILAIIPARSGSKGVEDKNIKLLAGKPLMAYSIEAALKSKLLNKTMVSTDSENYANIARQYEAEVPFLRPEHLATDGTASIDVVLHALQFYKDNGEHFDAVCILQPTTPFRESGLIDKAIEAFEKSGADALISVIPVPHEYNPHWVFEPDNNKMLKIATGEKEIIKRRQELPPAFIRDGSIYITKTEVVLNEKSLYGRQLAYLENNPALHVNIDTEADWKKAEELASKYFLA
jgi:N-acylneuraminate cytidylyltransferase